MALRNEIRDFVDTFGAGTRIVDSIKNRQLAERRQNWAEESDADRRATQKSQFAETMGLNTRRQENFEENQRLTRERQERQDTRQTEQDAENKRRWEAEQERLAAAALESRRATRFTEERQTRSDRLAEYAAAKKAYDDYIADNPSMLSETQPPNPADYGIGSGIPAGGDVGPSSYGPRTMPGEGIPTGAGRDASPPASGAAAPAEEPLSPEESPPTDETGEFLEPSAEGATGVVGGGAYTMEDIGITEADRREAIKGGLKHLQSYYGLDKVGISAGPDAEAGKAAFVAGKEASDPFEAQNVDYVLDDMDRANGIDPDQLNDTLRNIRRTAKSWKMWMQKGDTEKANATAGSMLMQSRHAAAMLAQMAQAKIKQGDIRGGTADAIKAYEQVPNGRDVDYDPETGRYKFTDMATGKVISEGVATPEDILGAAVGMANGAGFWSEVMNSVKDKDTRERLGATMPYEEAAPEDVKLPTRDKKAGITADETGALTIGGDDEEGGNGGPVTQLGKASIDDTIKATLINSPAMRAQLQSPNAIAARPDMTPEEQQQADNAAWTEIEAKMGLERVASLQDLARMITEYNNVPPARAAQLAISIADPDPREDTERGERNWNFKMLKGSNENAMALIAEDGTRVVLPTGLATPQILNASEGLHEAAIGMKDRRFAEGRQRLQNVDKYLTRERTDAADEALGARLDAEKQPSGTTSPDVAIKQLQDAGQAIIDLPSRFGTGRGGVRRALPVDDGRSASPRTRKGEKPKGGRIH